MPKSSVRESFEMETRNKYTKVDTEVVILIDGKELPNAAVLGEALDKCIELVKETVANSYKVVPPRVDTPIAEPYALPVKAEQVVTATPAPPTPVVNVPDASPSEPPVVRIPSTFGN